MIDKTFWFYPRYLRKMRRQRSTEDLAGGGRNLGTDYLARDHTFVQSLYPTEQ